MISYDDDVLVLFAGTGQEPDTERGKTVVWQLGHLLHGVPLYEPGIGTWDMRLSRVAEAIGYGVLGRAEAMAHRVEFFPNARVSAFGESRGCEEAAHFCRLLAERGRPVHLCLLVDSVTARGRGALVRLFPRSWWRRPQVPRPAAEHVVHVMAGEEPDRFYVHDDLDADAFLTVPGLEHGRAIRETAELCAKIAVGYGLRRIST